MTIQDPGIPALMSVPQAAKVIGVSRRALSYAISEDKIPVYRVAESPNDGKGFIVIREEIVLAFKAARDARPQRRQPAAGQEQH